MKIVLKNIQVNERLSEETTCFAATIYIDDVRAGEASNRGHGGNTSYNALDERGAELIRKAEKYCKGLPPRTYEGMGVEGKDLVVKMDLEGFIDGLITDHLTKKDLTQYNRKLEKAMQEGIVVGIPDESFRAWKLKVPVARYMESDRTKEILRKIIVGRVVPDLKKDEVILNHNFPADFVKLLKVGDRLVPQGRVSREDSLGSDQARGERQGRRSGR